MPATFFLCGSFLEGAPRAYWWQRLQRAVDGGVDVSPLLGRGNIRQQGLVMEALAREQRDAAVEKLDGLAAPTPRTELLTADDARRLPHIGFHTVDHHPLTRLDDEQLIRALSKGRAELTDIAAHPVDTIAYPYGRYDSRVIAAARKCGFAIGVTCEPKAVTPGTDPLAMGRYEPPFRGPTGTFAFSLARLLLKCRSA
jgi:peptidoglycan/xylan/chitin deacetylase (PgdA/CDA1 family)